MPMTNVINTLKDEIGQIDASLLEIEKDRQTMIEDRARIVRAINWLTGEQLPEVSIHAFENAKGKLTVAKNGHIKNAHGKKKKYQPKVGDEPTPGSKKFQVLDALRKLGPMTSAQLSEMLDYDKNALSAQLVLLGHQRLVEKMPDPNGPYSIYKAVTAETVRAAAG